MIPFENTISLTDTLHFGLKKKTRVNRIDGLKQPRPGDLEHAAERPPQQHQPPREKKGMHGAEHEQHLKRGKREAPKER